MLRVLTSQILGIKSIGENSSFFMGKEYCLTFKVKVANDISPFKKEYSTPSSKEFKENSFPKSCNLTKFLLIFLGSETINFSIYSINFLFRFKLSKYFSFKF